jgi:hypothetical protein
VSDDYARLARERPSKVRDWTATWNRLRLISDAPEAARDAIASFCLRKRITVDSLEALGARIYRHHDYGYCLAYAGSNGNGMVTAIKYRPLNGTSRDSFAERPSVWLRPIIVGRLDSQSWLIVEGETDAARLHGLVGDDCTILVLPAGALTFNPEWAAPIPRGARIALCHDADSRGDAGAEKAAEIVGGRLLRIRPPIEGDWCDWDGDREAFLRLVEEVSTRRRWGFSTYDEFAAREFPPAEPLLGEKGKILLARGSLLMTYGADGSGKSTWQIDGIVHLAAGVDWLGIPVPRPVRILVIENEGPPSLFQQKLRDKINDWEGPDPGPNLHVFCAPWGEFSFADPDARATLNEYCDEHQIDLVAANPTLGLGVGASGKPDETEQFKDWLVECGLKTRRAFWLLHHENKAGQISGDWGRHPDTKVSLQRDGDHQRTKLDWAKTRWATLDPEEKLVMLEWVTETEGYTVTTLAAATTSDAELDALIEAYLTEHPGSSTRAVREGVKGRDGHINARLKAKFDFVKGPRGVKKWMPPSVALDRWLEGGIEDENAN